MGAREKLHTFYFCTCSVIAAIAGLVSQSWTIFAIGLLAGVMLKFYDSGIRVATRRRRR